jgi:hypothetical protein
MAGQCKDCRFYDGKNCAIHGQRTHNSTCAHWVSNTGPCTAKQCKDCRFYNGKICSIHGQRTQNSTCSKWSAYR